MKTIESQMSSEHFSSSQFPSSPSSSSQSSSSGASSNYRPSGKRADNNNFKFVYSLLVPYWRSLSLAFLALIVASSINLSLPQIARFLIHEHNLVWISNNLALVSSLTVLLFGVQGLAFYFRARLFSIVGQLVTADLRRILFKELSLKSIIFFDSNRTGDLVSRLINDCALIQDLVSLKLSVLIRYSVQVIVGVILMATITPKLTFLLLLGLPILVGLSLFLSKSLKKVSKAVQTKIGEATSFAEESFSGHRVIKAFNAESRTIASFAEINDGILKLGFKRSKLAAFFSSFVNFMMNTFLVLVVMYGFTLVAHSELSIGDLTAFLLYAVIVGVSFAFLANAYTEVAQTMGGVSRVLDLIDSSDFTSKEELTSYSKSQAIDKNTDVCEEFSPIRVEFKEVSFSYPQRSNDSNVLHDVSFSIEPGSVTALVGPSGAGKTTIISLLLGFYQPSAGQIIINQAAVNNGKTREFFPKISLVPQDPSLFGISIRENLFIGNPNSTEDQMMAVLRMLRLDSLIENLPQGLDSMLGDRSLQLSGGQRQRLAIARALLRKSGLIILDEATSSLDSETEAIAIETIQALRGKATILVIAHRLSTIKVSDKILVLNNGRIVEEGKHDSLLRANNLYKSMVERQELSSSAA